MVYGDGGGAIGRLELVGGRRTEMLLGHLSPVLRVCLCVAFGVLILAVEFCLLSHYVGIMECPGGQKCRLIELSVRENTAAACQENSSSLLMSNVRSPKVIDLDSSRCRLICFGIQN